MNRCRIDAALVWLLVGVTIIAPVEGANNALSAALESVTAEKVYHHVEVLADDTYEGRAAGSRGGRAAGKYILKYLQEFQLKPAGTSGEFTQTFSGDCRNILALKPGDDAKLQNDVIVVGAHYDHVGYGSNRNSFGPVGKIHNGADDNASGTSVLLETIDAFAKSGLTTRRTILFAFWDAEERGMVGSKYWLSHPTLPLGRVKLDVTLDMVGRLRNERLYLLGSRSGYGMRRLFSDPVDDNLLLDFSWDISANSDHWPFLEKRIPIALLHTGLHSDYHRPSDDVDKINRDGMREVCRYLLAALVKVANDDELPKFRDAVRWESESMRRRSEQPMPKATLSKWPADKPRPRLGINWRDDEAEPGSVYLVRVVEGTPAADAGLAVGDRVDEIDDRPFADSSVFERDIHALLDSAKPQFNLLIERRGHMRTVTVKLPPEQPQAEQN